MPDYTKKPVTLNDAILNKQFKIECPLCGCEQVNIKRNEMGGVVIACKKCKTTINTTTYYGNLNK